VHCASRDAWPASAYTSARALLSQLTLAEKVQLASGNNAPYSDCHFSRKECSYVGVIAGIPRLGISPIYLEDGPQGVADGMLGVTQWPSIMTLAQAWRPDVMARAGAAMGAEQVTKGSNVMLGPAVALVRVPWGGRNFEYISEDPFLNEKLTGPLVRAIVRVSCESNPARAKPAPPKNTNPTNPTNPLRSNPTTSQRA
jgi:beta-glucosidase